MRGVGIAASSVSHWRMSLAISAWTQGRSGTSRSTPLSSGEWRAGPNWTSR